MENGRNRQISNVLRDIYGQMGGQSPAVYYVANGPIRRRAWSCCEGIVNESL